MQNVHFSTSKIAELFQVNVSTVKRWIDRGLMKSDITPGGHRRVSRMHLVQFIKDNKRVAQGSYIVQRLASKNFDPQETWKTVYKSLLANDVSTCKSILREYYLSHSEITNMLENVLTPLLRHIGEEWERKKISIYQEHQMSFLVRSFLVEIADFIPEPPKTAQRAILACVEGDRHEIPLQMLAIVLKLHSIQSVVLGTNISASEIILAAKETGATFMLLTKVFSNGSGKKDLNILARYALSHKKVLVYGGSGWSEEDRKKFNDPRIFSTHSLVAFDNFLSRHTTGR